MDPLRVLAAFAGAGLLAPAVSAHHSDAGLDLSRLVTIEGEVTEFTWRNPHVYFTVAAQGAGGEPVAWTVQMASVATVSRMGWRHDSLSAGDRVSVGAYPARDGRPYAKFLSIDRADGVVMPTAFDAETGEVRLASPAVIAAAASIEGKWMADPATDTYPGRLDGLTRALLRLNGRARAARDAYDENSDENPELRCIGRPTPALIVYTDLYPLQIEFDRDDGTAIIRSQFFDEERTVYMDGRGHPGDDQLFHEGHSIGWWEDDTLIVDTTNFQSHRSPYQNGIPSGVRKHVVERYRLLEGGTRMEVEFTLEDPEYLLAPMTHGRTLIHSPHADMSAFDCDPESTRRFVPQEFEP